MTLDDRGVTLFRYLKPSAKIIGNTLLQECDREVILSNFWDKKMFIIINDMAVYFNSHLYVRMDERYFKIARRNNVLRLFITQREYNRIINYKPDNLKKKDGLDGVCDRFIKS